MCSLTKSSVTKAATASADPLAKCGEIAGGDLGRAQPHTSWALAYTPWSQEISITFPSGSLIAQM